MRSTTTFRFGSAQDDGILKIGIAERELDV
jgi:hypothetical protein